MSMIIRQVKANDVPALQALTVETFTTAFGHTLSESDLVAHLKKNLSEEYFRRVINDDTILLAKDAGTITGFAQFGTVTLPVDANDQDQQLHRLYVHPEFQNKGIGTALMEAALDHPRLKEAETVYLDVWEHNHGARKLYERYGFKVIGQYNFEVESDAETTLELIMARRHIGKKGINA